MRRFGYLPVAAVLAIAALLAIAFVVGVPTLPWATPEGPATGPGGQSPAAPASVSPPTPVATPMPKVTIKLADETVKQYGRLKLSADGFAPGEEVLVTAKPEGDAPPVELGRATADDKGHVADFGADLPDAITSGTRQVLVTGLTSHDQATTVLYVRSEKMFAVLNSYTPRLGDRLGYVSGGFDPGEEVKVYVGGTSGALMATLTADRAGNTAWTESPVPMVKPGEYELVFQGSGGKNSYVQQITVSPLTPSLELSPWSGPPGSKVELNGRGFLPNEEVKAYVGMGAEPVATFKTDQYGNYWGIGPIVVPVDGGGGKAAIRLVGQQSTAEVSQSFAVVGVKPWAELSSYSGMPGTTVSFSGGGFAAKEQVTVHLGNANGPVVAVAQTDEQGNVMRSGAAAVPADATATTPTSVTFTLVGESSRGEASAAFNVIPIARPSLGGEQRPH